MSPPVPKEIRAARAFLFQKKLHRISPRLFAASAKELDVPFKDLLGLIGRIQGQGQNQSFNRQELVAKSVKGDRGA